MFLLCDFIGNRVSIRKTYAQFFFNGFPKKPQNPRTGRKLILVEYRKKDTILRLKLKTLFTIKN